MYVSSKYIFYVKISFWKPGEDTKVLLMMHNHFYVNLVGFFFLTAYGAYSGYICYFDVKSEVRTCTNLEDCSMGVGFQEYYVALVMF